MSLKSILALTVMVSVCFDYGMSSSRCPPNYPFPSCPRDTDKPSETECCATHAHPGPPRYQCCEPEGPTPKPHHKPTAEPHHGAFTVWEITLIVIACILLLGIAIGICTCCCVCVAGCCRQTTNVFVRQSTYQTV